MAAQCLLGFTNARGAGAQEHADPRRTEAFDGLPQRLVEAVLLPKAIVGIDLSIDLSCLPMLPILSLSQHVFVGLECGQQMHVIGHHDEVREFVSLAIKLLQAVRDDLGQLRPT